MLILYHLNSGAVGSWKSEFSELLDKVYTTTYDGDMSTEIKNPLREIRLSVGLTLDQLAYRAEVSRLLIIRSEQAVYADPSPRLLETLLAFEVDGLDDEFVVLARYHEFQTETRKENYGKLRTVDTFKWYNPTVHPFVFWRMDSGVTAQIAISKYFCVHPALIHKFEKTPHLCVTPPGELMTALGQSGYSKELLDSFTKAYDTFKQSTRKF